MAELTTRDGGPPPADLPRGECILTALYDDEGKPAGIRVNQADPRILISGELLDATIGIRNGVLPLTDAGLDLTGCRPGHGHVGAVLRIHGVNRTVIYRITDYLPHIHEYIGEWPD